MPIKIENQISGYEVVTEIKDNSPAPPERSTEKLPLGDATDRIPANVVQMHEKVERPERLLGSTYKIKTPLSDHALYVTINDIVLNPDTPYEKRRPFEIFINSKNMDHFQWIVALTRIVSAVFRKVSLIRRAVISSGAENTPRLWSLKLVTRSKRICE